MGGVGAVTEPGFCLSGFAMEVFGTGVSLAP